MKEHMQLTPRQRLADMQESGYVNLVTSELEELLELNQLGMARIAVRQAFRSGFKLGDEQDMPEPITGLFKANRFAEVVPLVESSTQVEQLVINAFKHGVQVHG